MSKFYVGWAEESIVPEKKVSLAGQFFERISDHVETDISVTAMAVEADKKQMIFVSADVVSVRDALMWLSREKLKAILPEFDTRNLIVAATHTHTSHVIAVSHPLMKTPSEGELFGGSKDILNEFLPEGKEYTKKVNPDDSVMPPMEALEFISDKIALAAKNAWESRKEASYANEFGRAVVGMNRRVCYNDGSAQMWGDTNTANFVSLEGGNDSGIELLYMFDKNKKLTGIVANIACPSQVLEHRSFISADYWGEAKKFLREKFGNEIYLLALGGAGGDQCPRDLVRWVNPETPIDDPNIKRPNYIERKADPSAFDLKGCRKIGKRIANEIIDVFEEIEEIKDDITFEHKVIDLNLPLRKATMQEYKEAVRELEYYVAQNKDKEVFNFKDNARMHVYAGTIARYRAQQNIELVPIETHVIRFGDVAFATNPFELFLDYGNYVKARSHSKQTFIVQLCCGGKGYLPTEKAEKGGHYSAYISSGKVGHEGGDLLTRTHVEEINSMWK